MEKYNIILDNNRFEMELIWHILDLRKREPNMFYERIEKISFYFMFPYSIWSKSRNRRDFLPFENIESDTNRYQDNGSGIFYEFENVEINSEHFFDRYSNMVLDMSKDKDTYAVVFSNELAKYIKGKYPQIKLVQSEIKRSVYTEAPFEMNVIDYITYNNYRDKLQNKTTYILALNSFCKNSYRCSNLLSSNKLNFGIDRPIQCNDKNPSFGEMMKNELFVPIEEVNKINDEGIENFLIKANCEDRYEILEAYLYYLIKPEYRDFIRLDILKSCFTKR